MFRLVNLRSHDLTDVHAVVSFARWIDENGTRRRRFDQLALERDFILFMPLHWVIVHPITGASPFRGFTQAGLAGAGSRSRLSHQRGRRDVRADGPCQDQLRQVRPAWARKFVDMYLPDTDRVAIDLNRLHQIEPVTPPDAV